MSEQMSRRNSIFSLKVFFNKSLILSFGLFLTACQSSPPPVQKNTLQPKPVTQLPPMQVHKTGDGVQDIEWQISMIDNRKTLFFNQYPSFKLNSVSKSVSGHTGCNSLYGRYKYEVAQQKLDFDVMAGHESCHKALAQEADLMDTLQRVERFQLEGTTLYLLDDKGQRLIQEQPKR